MKKIQLTLTDAHGMREGNNGEKPDAEKLGRDWFRITDAANMIRLAQNRGQYHVMIAIFHT